MQRKWRNKIRPIHRLFLMITLALVLDVIELQARAAHAVQPAAARRFDFNTWLGMLELPFLATVVFFGFRTASALKGGLFGHGMALMAWGFLVMAVGHLHMQVEHFFHYNLFAELFGQPGGAVMWIIALVVTWALSGLGFYMIYKASKAG